MMPNRSPQRTACGALILLLACASPGNAEEDYHKPIPVPEAVNVTVELDKPKFFMGELILLHYCVENTGDKPFKMDFGGDYRSTVRALRFEVTAEDKDGKPLRDPYPSAAGLCMGGISHRPELKPKERYYASLALHAYVQIDKPGAYAIRVIHDLGWGEDADKKKRTGEAKIEVVMPTDAEAQQVVDRILALPEDHGGSAGERRNVYREFSTFSYPVYLPILMKLAQGGQREALQGIDGIATPEATRCLIDLLSGKDPELAREATLTLNRRLPDPRWKNEVGPRGIFEEMSSLIEERKALSKAAWLAEMAPAVRETARKFLASDAAKDQIIGAYIIECVGTVEDAPALMKTLNVALETSKTLAFETHGYPRPRGACQELLRAIETLLQRGMRPAADPKDPAEIAVFLVALRKEPSFRPEGWEARGLKWLEHPVPVLREHTLLSAPKPFPAEFIKALPRLILDCDADVQIAALHLAADQKTPDLKDPVLKCYATATEDWVRRSAFDAGVALGSRFEMLMILADRLDAENPGSTLPSLIEGTVATGGWGSTTAKPEDKPGLKARWMDFLKANEARFRANKLFTPGDPTLDPRLFVGWSFSLGDGTEWPRCDSTPH